MAQRDWHGFYLLQDELRRYTSADVDAAEAELGVRLPRGYRELMVDLGDGVVSAGLRAYPPDRIGAEQGLYQELIDTAWFFELPDEAVTPGYAKESVVIGDTDDGDLIIFHPERRELHVLPRHDVRTYSVGGDLWEVVAWFQESGILRLPHPFQYFEPHVGPVEAVNGFGREAHRIIAAIDGLNLHDALETTVQDRTYFVKAVGGYLYAADSGERVYVHLRCRADQAPDVRARLWDAAASVGVDWGEPWLMIK